MTGEEAFERLLNGVWNSSNKDVTPLSSMLVECEKAHKASGEPDEGWADWYARWLLGYIVTGAIRLT